MLAVLWARKIASKPNSLWDKAVGCVTQGDDAPLRGTSNYVVLSTFDSQRRGRASEVEIEIEKKESEEEAQTLVSTIDRNVTTQGMRDGVSGTTVAFGTKQQTQTEKRETGRAVERDPETTKNKDLTGVAKERVVVDKGEFVGLTGWRETLREGLVGAARVLSNRASPGCGMTAGTGFRSDCARWAGSGLFCAWLQQPAAGCGKVEL